MTTGFGVMSSPSRDFAVIAMDSRTEGMNGGEIKDNFSPGISKIYVGKNFALGIAGLGTQTSGAFIDYLKGKISIRGFYTILTGEGNIPKNAQGIKGLERTLLHGGRRIDPVERAIKLEHFMEFEMMNRYVSLAEGGSDECCAQMILATNKGGVGLYTVDTYGNVIDANDEGGNGYHCVGSGGSAIERYFETHEDEGKIIDSRLPRKLSMTSLDSGGCLLLADRVMELAKKKDQNTGGETEFVTIRRGKIVHWGERLKRDMASLREKRFREMLKTA